MTLSLCAEPPADEPTKQEQPAERIAMMKRRGLFAAVCGSGGRNCREAQGNCRDSLEEAPTATWCWDQLFCSERRDREHRS